ncbi:MAG: hypothetical protein QOD07_140 [Frankiaceae bacterium]|jgi:hypothetical protein|nr:hypothetical protein [Frankiaceae bacterium]
MADSEKPPEFTEDERAFLETYAMLLRLLFAPRSVVVPVRKDEEAA